MPTIPELSQDRLIRTLPGPAFAFLLEHLRYLGKPLLFASLLGVQLVLAGLGGLVVGRWPHSLALAGLLWLATGAVLVPLTERGPFGGDVRIALVTLASFGAYALALLFFRESRPIAAGAVPIGDRRRLVGGGMLLVASALLARRLLGGLPALPVEPGAPGEDGSVTGIPPGLPAPITPPEAFYVVSKNLSDPEVDVGSWRLQVAGLVDHPLDLRYEGLLALPAVEVVRTLECISNEVGGDLMSNGRWTGARLADVLQLTSVRAAATSITFTSVDGYSENMALAKALDPSTLLVYRLGGQLLPAKHGFPVRVLGSGTYGMKNPKWLTRIEVVATTEAGFWTQQGWDPDAPVQTMARIDTPDNGAAVTGDEVIVGGVAFAAERGIERVEVSSDGGISWADAQLLPSFGASTWAFWQFSWHPGQPGTSNLVARATDGGGQIQTDRRADTFPQGATGHHAIQVHVSG